jgi:hypothetical protein
MRQERGPVSDLVVLTLTGYDAADAVLEQVSPAAFAGRTVAGLDAQGTVQVLGPGFQICRLAGPVRARRRESAFPVEHPHGRAVVQHVGEFDRCQTVRQGHGHRSGPLDGAVGDREGDPVLRGEQQPHALAAPEPSGEQAMGDGVGAQVPLPHGQLAMTGDG